MGNRPVWQLGASKLAELIAGGELSALDAVTAAVEQVRRHRRVPETSEVYPMSPAFRWKDFQQDRVLDFRPEDFFASLCA